MSIWISAFAGMTKGTPALDWHLEREALLSHSLYPLYLHDLSNRRRSKFLFYHRV